MITSLFIYCSDIARSPKRDIEGITHADYILQWPLGYIPPSQECSDTSIASLQWGLSQMQPGTIHLVTHTPCLCMQHLPFFKLRDIQFKIKGDSKQLLLINYQHLLTHMRSLSMDRNKHRIKLWLLDEAEGRLTEYVVRDASLHPLEAHFIS